MRLLILGGEACPPSSAGDWPRPARSGTPTARRRPRSSRRPHASDPGKPITIGWPLHGWFVAAVDESGEPVRFGEPGELAIAGVGLGRYLDPQLDAERYAAPAGARVGARLPHRGRRARDDRGLRLRGTTRPPGQARWTAPGAGRGGGATERRRRRPRGGSRGRRPPRPATRSWSATWWATSTPLTSALRWQSSCPMAWRRSSWSSTRCRSEGRARSTAGPFPGRRRAPRARPIRR